MINKAIAKIFGTSNEREIRRIMPLVDGINTLEPEMKQLSDEQLRAKTEEFRQRTRERVDAVEDPDEKDRELATVLDETRSPYALLLYLAAKPAVLYAASYDPRVMVMSVEDFINGLRDSGLGDLLRRTRNHIAHMRA